GGGASGVTGAGPEARRDEKSAPPFWSPPKTLLATRDRFTPPPGPSSIQSVLGVLEARRRSRPGAFSSWQDIEKGGYVVVGSPATVRDRLKEIATHTGLGTLIPNFSVGNVPHHLTRKSMELFAREVMPAVREINGDEPAVREPARVDA